MDKGRSLLAFMILLSAFYVESRKRKSTSILTSENDVDFEAVIRLNACHAQRRMRRGAAEGPHLPSELGLPLWTSFSVVDGSNSEASAVPASQTPQFRGDGDS